MDYIFLIVFAVFATVMSTIFTLDANQTVKVLNETCSANKGIDTARVDVSNYIIKCKDGARFSIER
jgi:hypothetical protein